MSFTGESYDPHNYCSAVERSKAPGGRMTRRVTDDDGPAFDRLTDTESAIMGICGEQCSCADSPAAAAPPPQDRSSDSVIMSEATRISNPPSNARAVSMPWVSFPHLGQVRRPAPPAAPESDRRNAKDRYVARPPCPVDQLSVFPEPNDYSPPVPELTIHDSFRQPETPLVVNSPPPRYVRYVSM